MPIVKFSVYRLRVTIQVVMFSVKLRNCDKKMPSYDLLKIAVARLRMSDDPMHPVNRSNRPIRPRIAMSIQRLDVKLIN